MTVARPVTASGLYLCALATLVASKERIETLRRVFDAMFGDLPDMPPAGYGPPPRPGPRGPEQGRSPEPDVLRDAARAAQVHALHLVTGGEEPAKIDEDPGTGDESLAAREVLASATERLASTDFAELSPPSCSCCPGSCASSPWRCRCAGHAGRTRPARGRQTDLRNTLRQARRTGGHPLRLVRRAPLREPRRLVVLCDISGSMEPYARAMLQLLYCAAGGAEAEVFTFATRLTRLTGTLAHVRPGVALRQAAWRHRTGWAGPKLERRSQSSTTPTAAGAWRGGP